MRLRVKVQHYLAAGKSGPVAAESRAMNEVTEVMLMARRGEEHEGGGGGHDGAGSMRWLLTYADLITLLMAFFIILFAMSKVDAQKYSLLANSLKTAFFAGNSLINLPASNYVPAGGSGEGGGPTLQGIGAELSTSLIRLDPKLKDMLKITVDERGLTISLVGAALFDLGQATIRPDAEKILTEIARSLAQVPNYVSVEGSTDDLPINTAEFPTNWELSTRRATNVVRFFIEHEGLNPKRFMAVGYGEYRPLYPNDSEANRAKNRRVDIVILRHSPVNPQETAPR